MPLLQKHDMLPDGNGTNRWCVVRKIGEGQFAEVYEVKDYSNNGDKFAIKIEKKPKVLKTEQKVLFKLQHVPQVCKLYNQGVHVDKFFIVLELLGQNLVEYRKQAGVDGKLDVERMKVIGLSMLNAIEGVHKAGYIHRDVKPANFAQYPRTAIGRPDDVSWNLIDFGLSRKHLEHGVVYPARPDAAFRGSTTYASVNTHLGQDQGRRDDLWSWFYILVELLEGNLPWRADVHQIEREGDKEPLKDKEIVLKKKQQFIKYPHDLAANGKLYESLVKISNYLAGLEYSDSPSYSYLHECLGFPPSDDQPARSLLSSMPSASSPCHLTSITNGTVTAIGARTTHIGLAPASRPAVEPITTATTRDAPQLKPTTQSSDKEQGEKAGPSADERADGATDSSHAAPGSTQDATRDARPSCAPDTKQPPEGPSSSNQKADTNGVDKTHTTQQNGAPEKPQVKLEPKSPTVRPDVKRDTISEATTRSDVKRDVKSEATMRPDVKQEAKAGAVPVSKASMDGNTVTQCDTGVASPDRKSLSDTKSNQNGSIPSIFLRSKKRSPADQSGPALKKPANNAVQPKSPSSNSNLPTAAVRRKSALSLTPRSAPPSKQPGQSPSDTKPSATKGATNPVRKEGTPRMQESELKRKRGGEATAEESLAAQRPRRLNAGKREERTSDAHAKTTSSSPQKSNKLGSGNKGSTLPAAAKMGSPVAATKVSSPSTAGAAKSPQPPAKQAPERAAVQGTKAAAARAASGKLAGPSTVPGVTSSGRVVLVGDQAQLLQHVELSVKEFRQACKEPSNAVPKRVLDSLRSAPPVDAFLAMGAAVQSMRDNMDPLAQGLVVSWMEDLAAYLQNTARQCRENHAAAVATHIQAAKDKAVKPVAK